MGRLSQWFKKAGAGILAAIRRFPATIGIAAVIMILSLILIHREATLTDAVQKWLMRTMLTLALGIPLSVALELYFERREGRRIYYRLALWGALAGMLVLYLFFLLPVVDNPIAGIRYVALLLAAITLVPAIPYLFRRQGDERFALKLVLRLMITGIFTGILIGGIDLVLLMLEKLLAVKLWEHAYVDVAIISAGLFAPSFLLAGVPRRDTDFEREPFQPLVRVLLGYIAFPLLAVYTVIIYIYFIRILLLWSWPSNMLVNMVLWYTVIGVLAIYFMRTQNALNRWFGLIDRWYPRLTVLPIVLAFAGIMIRIHAYGITEPRYFVLVLAVWVAAATVLMMIYRPEKRHNVLLPALLALLAVLSVLGPWSAFGVSAASQSARLKTLLVQNSMLTASGVILPKKDITELDKQEIYNILDYFERMHGLESAQVLPAGTTVDKLPGILGFDRSALPGNPGASYYISSGMPEATLDISGYDYLFIGNSNKGNQIKPNGIVIKTDDQSVFTIEKDGKTIYTKDLKQYAKSYEGAYVQARVYTLEELTWTDENSQVKVKFIINEAMMNTINGVSAYSVPNFYALVDLK